LADAMVDGDPSLAEKDQHHNKTRPKRKPLTAAGRRLAGILLLLVVNFVWVCFLISKFLDKILKRGFLGWISRINTIFVF
jgi:small neutral amino acid transporter SnatA (MarC family)